MTAQETGQVIHCDKAGDIECLHVFWRNGAIRLAVYPWGEDRPLIRGVLTPPIVSQLVDGLTQEVDRHWRKEVTHATNNG